MIVDPISPSWPKALRILLHAKQKIGRYQHRAERLLDARVEVSRPAASLIESKQRFQVRVSHRPAKSTMRDRREDVLCARLLVFRGTGPANKNSFAAWGPSATGHVVRPANDY